MADRFVILTDSASDLKAETAEELGLEVLPLSLHIGPAVYRNYLDERELDTATFYRQLREEGILPTTSAINTAEWAAAMEPHLQQGEDVLVLAFSSGLSATYQSAQIAAEDLAEQYPDRKIRVIDTLCASLGEGLLVYLAAKRRQAGASMEEVADYVLETRPHLWHWFTVDDLNHLRRGGRISGATALLGTLLGIKPILHVDDEGHLIPMGKVRGRRASIAALVDQMEKSAINPASQEIFISHGDCLSDAELLAEMIRNRLGVQSIYINYVGPVIGAHSGPGTLALFFVGDAR